MLGEYWGAIRRNLVVGLVILLLAPVAGFGFVKAQKPAFTASTELYLQLDQVGSVTDLATGAGYVLGQMKSYESVVLAPSVTQPVIDDLGLGMTTDDLSKQISTSTTTDSTILRITCEAGTAQQAADICNRTAEQFKNKVPSLATFKTKEMGKLTAQILTPAMPPKISSNPSLKLVLAVSVFVGLLAAAAGCVMADRLRSSKEDTSDE